MAARSLALFLSLLLFGNSTALAQPTAAIREEAGRLYVRALELSRKGDLTGAIALFEQAHRLGDLRNALWNLAQCHRQLGRLATARTYVLRFRDHPKAPPDDRALAARELTELERTIPRLIVETKPPGARVVIDGQEAGAAPLEVWLDPGPHALEVASPGFAARRTALTLAVGERRTLSLPLQLLPARLRVSSHPAGALVRARGRALGKAPIEAEVAAGTFEVDAQLPDHRTERRLVTVGPGERISVDLQLTLRQTTLVVGVDQPGARITLNGRLAGEAPLAPRTLPPGDTRIAVLAPGHDGWSTRVALSDGETATVSVQLRRGRLHPIWFTATAVLGAGLLAGGGALLSESQSAADNHRAMSTRLSSGKVPLNDVDSFKSRMRAVSERSQARYDQAAALFGLGAGALVAAGLVAFFTRWRRSEGRVVLSGTGLRF